MHPLGNKRRSYPSDAEAGNLYNHYMKRLAFLFLFLGLCLGLQAKTRVEIAEENSPAIVAVNVLKKDGSTFTGTGFVVSEDGVIATSGHVIQDALYMNITFNTGAVSGQAMPLAAAEKVDLALSKILEMLENDGYIMKNGALRTFRSPLLRDYWFDKFVR